MGDDRTLGLSGRTGGVEDRRILVGIEREGDILDRLSLQEADGRPAEPAHFRRVELLRLAAARQHVEIFTDHRS